MPHKRSFEAKQRRAAKRIILEMAYRDRLTAETVNRLNVIDLINHISKAFGGKVHLGSIPRVEEGAIEDWKKLARFHYRSHEIPVPRKIFKLMRGEELCGVIVYSYPPATCFGRRLVLPRMSQKELNEKLSTISRVVIHPKYRSIGLGQKIVRETLPLAGTQYVEMVAVMAKYNPFAEKAGMKKILESEPRTGLIKIINRLKEIGFNICLLTCEKYVLNKIKNLDEESIKMIKESFMEVFHPRFARVLKPNKAFLRRQDYIEGIRSLSVEKITRLIKTCSILAQAKVYLFWQRPQL